MNDLLFDDILATLMVLGSLIVVFQILIIVSFWRKGSKYAAMERAYRQRQIIANEREAQRRASPLINWDIHEEDREGPIDHTAWDKQATLDDPPKT